MGQDGLATPGRGGAIRKAGQRDRPTDGIRSRAEGDESIGPEQKTEMADPVLFSAAVRADNGGAWVNTCPARLGKDYSKQEQATRLVSTGTGNR